MCSYMWVDTWLYESESGDGSWEVAQKYCQRELISKVIAAY